MKKLFITFTSILCGVVSVFAQNLPDSTGNKASQTITFDSLAAKTYGDPPFTLTARASSGLPISFVSSDTTVAVVHDSTVTVMKAGTTVITASQNGDANYLAAPDVQQNLTVRKANQQLNFDSLAAKTYGDLPFNLTATASSRLTVSYSSSDTTVAVLNGSTVMLLKPGTTLITAGQGGDANYLPAVNVQQTLTVNPSNRASQTITFDSLVAKTFGDPPFDLTATASSGLTVSYSSSDTIVAVVNGSTVTIRMAGTTVITASQSGDANYLPAANVQQTLRVNQPNRTSQTITFDSLAAKTFGDPPFTLTAISSSGLTVSYASSDSTVAVVNGSRVTIRMAGSTVITASQSGDANYFPAASVQQTLTVNPANRKSQTITFDSLATKTYGDPLFTLTATASSGLTVSYTSSDTTLVSVHGSTVTIKSAGTVVITASQSGNANYAAAESVQQVLTVNQATQTITFNALPVKVVGAPSFILGATASSSFQITYSSSDTSVVTLNGPVATIISAGTAIITASQPGYPNAYFPAADVQQTLTVVNPSYVISPKNGSTGQSIAPAVTAQAQFGATTYTLYLSPVADFSTGVVSISGSRNQNFSGLSYNTVYYARVKTDLSALYGNTTSFTTINPLSLTFVTSPKDGAKNVSTAATVMTNIIPGATNYVYELNTDPNFITGTSIQNTSSTNSTSFSGLNNSTTYYARVQTDVVPGTWGITTSFTTGARRKSLLAARDGTGDIDTLVVETLNVYPVPFHNQLVVNVRSAEPECVMLHLYDLNGKESARYQGTTNTFMELETGDLNAGMYILKSETTAGIIFKKVIRE